MRQFEAAPRSWRSAMHRTPAAGTGPDLASVVAMTARAAWGSSPRGGRPGPGRSLPRRALRPSTMVGKARSRARAYVRSCALAVWRDQLDTGAYQDPRIELACSPAPCTTSRSTCVNDPAPTRTAPLNARQEGQRAVTVRCCSHTVHLVCSEKNASAFGDARVSASRRPRSGPAPKAPLERGRQRHVVCGRRAPEAAGWPIRGAGPRRRTCGARGPAQRARGTRVSPAPRDAADLSSPAHPRCERHTAALASRR